MHEYLLTEILGDDFQRYRTRRHTYITTTMLLQFNKNTRKFTKRKSKIKYTCLTRTYIQECYMFL